MGRSQKIGEGSFENQSPGWTKDLGRVGSEKRLESRYSLKIGQKGRSYGCSQDSERRRRQGAGIGAVLNGERAKLRLSYPSVKQKLPRSEPVTWTTQQHCGQAHVSW